MVCDSPVLGAPHYFPSDFLVSNRAPLFEWRGKNKEGKKVEEESREEVMEDEVTARQAQEAFAKHEILREDRTPNLLSYTIGRPGDSAFNTTVMAGTHGCLLVYGDIETVAFQFGPADLDSRIGWLAAKKVSHYFLEKASIGMGGQEMLLVWDKDQATRDIIELAQVYEECGSSKSIVFDIRKFASELSSYETEDEILRELCDLSIDVEDLCHIGKLYAPRLYYAHAAICKLNALLDLRRTDG